MVKTHQHCIYQWPAQMHPVGAVLPGGWGRRKHRGAAERFRVKGVGNERRYRGTL